MSILGDGKNFCFLKKTETAAEEPITTLDSRKIDDARWEIILTIDNTKLLNTKNVILYFNVRKFSSLAATYKFTNAVGSGTLAVIGAKGYAVSAPDGYDVVATVFDITGVANTDTIGKIESTAIDYAKVLKIVLECSGEDPTAGTSNFIFYLEKKNELGGGISELSDDLTPQYGGDMDTNGYNTGKISQVSATENESKLMETIDFVDDFVVSGLLPATSADLTSDISAGVAYITGVRNVKAATSHTYFPLADTYIDIDSTGTYKFPVRGNGLPEPALTADSIRLAKVITDGSAITTVEDRRQFLKVWLTEDHETYLESDGTNIWIKGIGKAPRIYFHNTNQDGTTDIAYIESWYDAHMDFGLRFASKDNTEGILFQLHSGTIKWIGTTPARFYTGHIAAGVMAYPNGVNSFNSYHDRNEFKKHTRRLVQAGIAAAGDSQATATELTGDLCEISSGTAGTADGVKLPAAVAGMEKPLVNHSGITINVFPATDGYINDLAQNAEKTIADNVTFLCHCYVAGKWEITSLTR